MNGTARVLVVQNTPNGGPGRLGRWLSEQGLELDVRHAYDGQALPEDLAGHEAVVVLGGGFMPDADERAPWLARTRVLVAEALEAGAPVLGVCLGGQLLAHVAGGTVRAEHGQPEVGSTALELLEDAAGDPLFDGLPTDLRAVENRVDAITELPPGAPWLVRSRHCPYQAFRVGERAWGLQFHPESTTENIRGWDAETVREKGFDHEELIRAAERDEPAASKVWHEVARRFAAVVTSHAGAPAVARD